MRLRSESRWAGLHREAIQRAEDLATAAGASFPTNLGAIAARRGVRSIQFRPLASDGGLAVVDNGFIIYVNADPGEGEDLTAQFAVDGTGAALPRRIVRRARFTVAHEIAHTLFYDRRTHPPQMSIELKNSRSVQSLERVCNSIAGTLLLPEASLSANRRKFDLGNPDELSTLADTALISKQALVRRLQSFREFPHPIGIIACVHRRDAKCIVDGVSRHYSLRQMFTEAKDGESLERLIDHPDFILNGGDFSEVDTEVRGVFGKMNLRFRCEHHIRTKGNGTYFVTAIRLD